MNKQKAFKMGKYYRLSREDGDNKESDSISSQRELIKSYINQDSDLIDTKEYVDDGYTGTNFNRPGFIQMIEDIEKGIINCVIVKDLSRFGRDYIAAGHYLEEYFVDKEVRFIAINDNIDSYDGEYDLLVPIKNVFNGQYPKDISKKVQSSFKTKQSQGMFIGAFAKYGYKKDPKDRHKLVIDEEVSANVKRIYELYANGTKKQTIARILNEDFIPCPTVYKSQKGMKYSNGMKLESTKYWTYSTIDHILNDEMYIGNMVQGTHKRRMHGKARPLPKSQWIIVNNTHEPIIDMELWNSVQQLQKYATKHMDCTQNISKFGGMIICADCGRTLVKYHYKRQPTKEDPNHIWRDYVCGTYKKFGAKYCTSHKIEIDMLEQIIIKDINKMILNIKNLDEMIKAQSSPTIDLQRSIQNIITKTTKALTLIKIKKKNLYRDYTDQLLTKEEYKELKSDFTKEEQALENKLEKLQSEQSDNKLKTYMDAPWVQYLLNKKEIQYLERVDVVQLINKILVYEDKKIEITYNFSEEYDALFDKVVEVAKNN